MKGLILALNCCSNLCSCFGHMSTLQLVKEKIVFLAKASKRSKHQFLKKCNNLHILQLFSHSADRRAFYLDREYKSQIKEL